MEMKQFVCVCNDCGCRFELRIVESGKPAAKTIEKKSKTGPRRITCPECESFNITTA